MKILSPDAIRLWCVENGISLTDRGLPEGSAKARKFDIPADAQQRVALVAEKMKAFETLPAFAVWFDDWSVWPSGQRMHIFDRFRSSYGETRNLIASPGHLFQAQELEDAISFVTIGVLFLWDCYVVTPQQTAFLFFSHDEWGLSQEIGTSPSSTTHH
jgi:hypothetical protein